MQKYPASIQVDFLTSGSQEKNTRHSKKKKQEKLLHEERTENSPEVTETLEPVGWEHDNKHFHNCTHGKNKNKGNTGHVKYKNKLFHLNFYK